MNLLVHWEKGEDKSWCLATNLPDRITTLRFYARRMWIKEMFSNLKKYGFDLESTILRHFEPLSRLTLAVVLLDIWSLTAGVKTIHRGLRELVDRKERRDLSIFQIGLRMIERSVINGLDLRISLCGYQLIQTVKWLEEDYCSQSSNPVTQQPGSLCRPFRGHFR